MKSCVSQTKLLDFIILQGIETGSHHVTQAGLKILLISLISAGITNMHHHNWFIKTFQLKRNILVLYIQKIFFTRVFRIDWNKIRIVKKKKKLLH
jgi:hypothetical protein